MLLLHRDKNECQKLKSLCAGIHEAIQSQICAREVRFKCLNRLKASSGGEHQASDCTLFRRLIDLDQELIP